MFIRLFSFFCFYKRFIIHRDGTIAELQKFVTLIEKLQSVANGSEPNQCAGILETLFTDLDYQEHLKVGSNARRQKKNLFFLTKMRIVSQEDKTLLPRFFKTFKSEYVRKRVGEPLGQRAGAASHGSLV